MNITLTHQNKLYKVNLRRAHDISITLDNSGGPKCFYAPDFRIEPVKTENFIGDIALGGMVNFKNVFINPHGNGTHTECVGHITNGDYFIGEALQKFLFFSKVITVTPDQMPNGDQVIRKGLVSHLLQKNEDIEALIIRTSPNDREKLKRDYSNTNPPYIDASTMQYFNDVGIQHLIVDLPSVDREVDGGAFAAHKMFWEVSDTIALNKTITELVFVPELVQDGYYLCNIQTLNIKMDASPSRIVLFPLEEVLTK